MWNRLRWRIGRLRAEENDRNAEADTDDRDPRHLNSSAPPSPSTSTDPDGTTASPPPYYPSSRHDVYHTAFLLRQRLVPELIPQILDEAEYWTVRTQRTDMVPRIAEAARGHVILATDPPISREESRRVRRVVISVRSRDQGWGGDPADRETERGSWTWFEAHIKKRGQRWHRSGDMPPPPADENVQPGEGEKAEPSSEGTDETERPGGYDEEADDADPRPRAAPPVPRDKAPWEGPRLMTNLTASQVYRTQRVEWRAEDEAVGADGEVVGEKVRGLREGDRIALTAHAIFPGWVNVVSWAEMRIYVAHVR